jgi:hypothetical protein
VAVIQLVGQLAVLQYPSFVLCAVCHVLIGQRELAEKGFQVVVGESCVLIGQQESAEVGSQALRGERVAVCEEALLKIQWSGFQEYGTEEGLLHRQIHHVAIVMNSTKT